MVVLASGWWLTHADAVPNTVGNEIGVTLAVGEGMLLDAGIYSQQVLDDPNDTVSITVVAASPNVVENTAEADVELVLCQHSGDGQDILGTAAASDIDAACTALLPVEGTTFASPTEAQLLVRITPHQAGTVRVEGIDLSYREGIRRASVRSGTVLIATAS